MLIFYSNLLPEEIDFLTGFLADCGQLCLVIFGQLVDSVLQVLTLGDNGRIVDIYLFLDLGSYSLAYR